MRGYYVFDKIWEGFYCNCAGCRVSTFQLPTYFIVDIPYSCSGGGSHTPGYEGFKRVFSIYGCNSSVGSSASNYSNSKVVTSKTSYGITRYFPRSGPYLPRRVRDDYGFGYILNIPPVRSYLGTIN